MKKKKTLKAAEARQEAWVGLCDGRLVFSEWQRDGPPFAELFRSRRAARRVYEDVAHVLIYKSEAGAGKSESEGMNMRKNRSRENRAKRERPVVVTTAHRGVFFGYADRTRGKTIALRRARCCLYWSPDVKGFIGLAANGPTEHCRVGPAADIEVRDVTAVLETDPKAVARWEAEPWA